jgi:3-phosphoshikimate 1-carboxyvinyltransferase
VALLQHLVLPDQLKLTVNLPGSKSESNRALLLHYLSGHRVRFTGLSNCEDVILLQKILEKSSKQVNVKDSGTALRFLIAYFCLTNKNRIINGSQALCQRPVGPLVNALCQLGFRIHYLRKDGYPPVEIIPVDHRSLKKKAEINPSESSQYISALLLIAPLMPNGLELKMTAMPVSAPYYSMTLDMLSRAGIHYSLAGQHIYIARQPFRPVELNIEADWSAAACWYAMAALAAHADIHLKGLRSPSLQGDSIIAQWMNHFGVQSRFTPDGVQLTKTEIHHPDKLELDFTDYPDLAPVMMVVSAACNVSLHCTGIRHLRIKESDRIEAMRNELVKINCRLEVLGPDECRLYPAFRILNNRFSSYRDHRMVLAFAPLAVKRRIMIEDPQTVRKSYPDFWNDIRSINLAESA